MLAWDQLRPVVLNQIADGEFTAAEIRLRLERVAVSLSPLAFRGMLAALERAGLVAGRFSAGTPDAAVTRLYRLTPAGANERQARNSGFGWREAA